MCFVYILFCRMHSMHACTVLRRSSSFKRRVTQRSASQVAEAADTPSSTSIVARGELFCLPGGKKAQPCFAVCYAGRTGKSLVLHRSKQEFTSFRAFPEDISYFSHEQMRVVEERSDTPITGGPSHFLRIDGDAHHVPIILGFRARAELETWSSALQQLPPASMPAGAPAREQELERKAQETAAAEQQRVGARRHALETQKRQLVEGREAVARIARESERLQAEFARLVEVLPGELDAVP